MEWRLTPASFTTLKHGCSGDEATRCWNPRSMPCDVAATLERSATDGAGMTRVAGRLDANVVTIEKINGAEAAAQRPAGHRFAVLGDFNREPLSEPDEGLWARLSVGGPETPLINTADGEASPQLLCQTDLRRLHRLHPAQHGACAAARFLRAAVLFPGRRLAPEALGSLPGYSPAAP